MARQLSQRERAALVRLLNADFPGARELRNQTESARVVGGSPLLLDLAVDAATPIAPVSSRRPVEANVRDPHFGEGGLIVWVDDGRLSGFEYWWTSDEAPSQFPAVEHIGTPSPTEPDR